MTDPSLELGDIQGDVLIGLQKHAECFVFFKVVDPSLFKRLMKLHIVRRITSACRPITGSNCLRGAVATGDRPAPLSG